MVTNTSPSQDPLAAWDPPGWHFCGTTAPQEGEASGETLEGCLGVHVTKASHPGLTGQTPRPLCLFRSSRSIFTLVTKQQGFMPKIDVVGNRPPSYPRNLSKGFCTQPDARAHPRPRGSARREMTSWDHHVPLWLRLGKLQRGADLFSLGLVTPNERVPCIRPQASADVRCTAEGPGPLRPQPSPGTTGWQPCGLGGIRETPGEAEGGPRGHTAGAPRSSGAVGGGSGRAETTGRCILERRLVRVKPRKASP